MPTNNEVWFKQDMQFSKVAPASNALLEGLPNKDREAFIAQCESVQLTLGDALCNAGDVIEHVYFPIESNISLVNPVDGNVGMKVALIGSEGMLGISLMLGSKIAPFRALVQGAGTALRITVSAFLNQLEQSAELQLQLKRYIYVSFSQLVQTSVCNRFHVVEERLARLLLMIKDRKHSKEFYITQELLAQMLGVRRVGVTKAAGSLQARKLISYSRGDLKILNVSGLESVSCVCYQTDKETYERIFHNQEVPSMV